MEETIIEMETNLLGEEVRVDRFDKFRHSNGAFYAFAERPISFLDVEVPEGAKWGSVPTGESDEDGKPITRQKIVSEFVLSSVKSIDGEKVLISLAAMEHPTLRQKAVSRQDLMDWEYFGYMVDGMVLDDWITSGERAELLSSEEYKQRAQ